MSIQPEFRPLAENAAENGVEFFLDTEVKEIKKDGDTYKVVTDKETYEAKAVVNAAGVYADDLNNMFSNKKI